MGISDTPWGVAIFWAVMGVGSTLVVASLLDAWAVQAKRKRERRDARIDREMRIDARLDSIDVHMKLIRGDTQKIRRYVVPRISGPSKQQSLAEMREKIQAAKAEMLRRARPEEQL